MRREAQDLGLERHARAGGRGHRLVAGERRADRGADAGDLVLRLQHHAAVLPDLAAEELHDLGRGRDRIAAEERAAGEDRGRARTSRCRRRGASAPRRAGPAPASAARARASGCSTAYRRPASNARSLRSSTSALFLPKRLRMPARSASGHQAEPPRQQAEDDGVLGRVGAGQLARHARRSARRRLAPACTPASGSARARRVCAS